MTYEQYLKRVDRIDLRNKRKAMRRALKDKKAQGDAPKKKIETNKLIAIYLFVLLNAIVLYSMVAMWKLGDLSYLGALISDLAAQVLVYAIYCTKAYAGKKQEENMKFAREQWLAELNNDEPETETDESEEET